jgi:DEAD/DEAH box helicase domain-containing protein
MMFICSKCNISGVVPPGSNRDEAYLGFLDLYDNGGAVKAQDLGLLLERERFLRPASEIDSLITRNHIQEDKLLKVILYSKKDYVVDFRVMKEREIEKGNEPGVLPIEDSLIKALYARNIKKLYQFQEESIKKILLGEDVVIVAPTGSGKTEAFSIPILQKISEAISCFSPMRPGLNGKGKVFAVFVYPTKALARDQLPKIRHLAEALGITVNVFDGDTTKAERDSIVINNLTPEIIITNFDVIHYHMLNRTKFSRLIKSAKFLVVDEVHVYSGVFGANIHHIIKRLERLVTSTNNNNNNKLQIIAASATLPNAQDFCQSLFGREMKVIVGKGRKGKINFVVLFPSLRSQRSLMLDLLRQATTTNHKTIAFNKSHLGSELLAFYSTKQGIKTRVHRAGLLATERKSVEDSFKSGKLLAISATPTLELGIDIGDVDAIISDVVPIDRLTQRLGRAARKGQEGYAFLALGNDPISQYYKLHPDDYLEDQQIAYTDPTNLFVEEYQVLAMCCDKPLSITESSSRSKTIDRLISKELVSLSKGKFIPNFKNAMDVLRDFSIRGIGNKVEITYNGKVIGERQMPQAIEELHNDAIYFLGGRRYQVKKLHFLGNQKKLVQPPIAYAELKSIPSDYPYYTKASVSEWPSILDTYEEKKSYGLQVMYCSLKIQKKVSGYSNIEIGKDALQGTKVLLDTAIEFEFVTKGLVFKSPQPKDILKASIDEQYVEMSGYHASEHTIIEGSSMITGGVSQDLGGISLGSSGLIFIYDGSIGGNGASRALYDKFDRAIIRALRIVSECSCESESGCPRCTYSYRCGNNNEYLQKQAAIEILNRIVDGEKTQIGETIHAQRALI